MLFLNKQLINRFATLPPDGSKDYQLRCTTTWLSSVCNTQHLCWPTVLDCLLLQVFNHHAGWLDHRCVQPLSAPWGGWEGNAEYQQRNKVHPPYFQNSVWVCVCARKSSQPFYLKMAEVNVMLKISHWVAARIHLSLCLLSPAAASPLLILYGAPARLQALLEFLKNSLLWTQKCEKKTDCENLMLAPHCLFVEKRRFEYFLAFCLSPQPVNVFQADITARIRNVRGAVQWQQHSAVDRLALFYSHYKPLCSVCDLVGLKIT